MSKFPSTKAAGGPLARNSGLYVEQYLSNAQAIYRLKTEKLVADRALPIYRVEKPSFLYPIWDLDDWFRVSLKPRAEFTRGNMEGMGVSDKRFETLPYSWLQGISDRARLSADNPLNLELAKNEILAQKTMIAKERLMARAIFQTGFWGIPASGQTTPTDKVPSPLWDDDMSTPITDVRDWNTEIEEGTGGFYPNTIIVGRETYNKLLDNNQVIERIKGGATIDKAAFVTQQLLAEAFEVDNLYVMGAPFNDALPGQARNMKFINKKMFWSGYMPTELAGTEPSAAGQFVFDRYDQAGTSEETNMTGTAIKMYREEGIEADILESVNDFLYTPLDSMLAWLAPTPVS